MLSNLFYIINFSFSIVCSIVALIFSLTTILIVLIHRQHYTIPNLVTCDSAVAIVLYNINNLVSTAYGFRNDWAFYQPACVFRGYCFIISCTALCYSHLIQAISRLFFTVLYKHNNLQTWRIHRNMIIINWILAFLIPIPPIFLNGYILEEESHLCIPTTQIFSSAMYLIFSVFLLPLISMKIIYGIIFYHARQSTRRVVDFVAKTNTITITSHITLPNFKREMILMRNMLILVVILTFGGTPYVIVVFWHFIQPEHLPESLYLLIINSITFFAALMMIALFYMNREVKNATVKYLRKFCT